VEALLLRATRVGRDRATVLLLRGLARLKVLRPNSPLFGRPLVVRIALFQYLIGWVDI
jgi:hypothetical protein